MSFRRGVQGWALLALWVASWVCGPSPARAQGFDILGAAQQKVTAEVAEEKTAAEARLAELQRIQGKRHARVIVLPWPDSTVGEDNLILKAMVQNQIGRPDAKFQPALDLYQEGRRRLFVDGLPADPLEQPGSVPDEVVARVRSQLTGYQQRLGNRFDDIATAGALLPLVDEIWFNDRQATRELLFDLYVTIGRAIFNYKNQTPPYYRMVGPEPTNYYLFLAAALAWEDERYGPPEGDEALALARRFPNGDVGDYLRDLVQLIDDGIHPTIPLAFHDQGLFDPYKFAKEYKVVINGVERIVDGSGMMMIPRGRIHVSLQRDDGFSMSERVEVQRLDDKIYFITETARQKMGYDLLNQLMVFPNECTPDLDAQTRASLATFQALHPKDEIYVAIPKLGSPYQTYVWRWEQETGTLHLLLDRNRGFPVRFALLTGAGLTFNGASLDTGALQQLEEAQPADAQAGGIGSVFGVDDLKSLVKMTPGGLPIDFQIRGQFNRFMFGFGAQFATNIAGGSDGKWHDRYQTNGNVVVPRSSTVADDGVDPADATVNPEVLRDLQWSRALYGNIGVFLLRDAAYGIGPRLFVRGGWHNAPHAIEATGHIGFTEDPSFGKKEYKGRVVPLIDLDLFAGALIPFGDTIFVGQPRDAGDLSQGYRPIVLPHLGFTAGFGFSF
jgi:hypothetical protein